MALIIQDSTGLVAGANSYATVQEFKDYHEARGNAYTATDTAIEHALVRARDYMDVRHTYYGEPLNDEGQSTEFPRKWLWNRQQTRQVLGVPQAVKNAQMEYALRALTVALMPDPDSSDPTGRRVQSRTEKVGPIEETVEYDWNSIPTMPQYPLADEMLYTPRLAKRPNLGGVGGGSTVRG